MPSHLNYNAFRSLRDSGFNPVQYALEAEITPETKAGLLVFRGMEMGRDYWDSKPGRVFVAGKEDFMDFWKPPYIQPAFRWGWGSASAVACLVGICLWRQKSRLGFPPPQMK